MPDREKIINGLHEMSCRATWKDIDRIRHKFQPIINGAIDLLKEQEPKQIVRKQGKRENSDGSIDYFGEWYCPHCGKLLNRGFDLPWIEFCYKCGKAVKWNEYIDVNQA